MIGYNIYKEVKDKKPPKFDLKPMGLDDVQSPFDKVHQMYHAALVENKGILDAVKNVLYKNDGELINDKTVKKITGEIKKHYLQIKYGVDDLAKLEVPNDVKKTITDELNRISISTDELKRHFGFDTKKPQVRARLVDDYVNREYTRKLDSETLNGINNHIRQVHPELETRKKISQAFAHYSGGDPDLLAQIDTYAKSGPEVFEDMTKQAIASAKHKVMQNIDDKIESLQAAEAKKKAEAVTA
ncbi:hypothetical protein JXA85_04985 [Candidatus Woesearchaeota archaeon]|nr:hypothetical protein [Candidatus Woesearchaeota archaeon]